MPASQGLEWGQADAESCEPLGTSYDGGPGRCDPGEIDDEGYADAYYAGYCEVHERKLDEDGVGCAEDGDEACFWPPPT